ncbi:hypothetical protein [Actinomycetospora sp. CA-084318]|uniref:hypothetical protein n=1 Tax=Actinomycetospora sp. CA-084318 TaxID=3239892 RepID=UPI003D960895
MSRSNHGLSIGLGFAAALVPGEYGPLAARAEQMGVDELVVHGDLMFRSSTTFLELEAAGVDQVDLGNPFGLDERRGPDLLADRVPPALRGSLGS